MTEKIEVFTKPDAVASAKKAQAAKVAPVATSTTEEPQPGHRVFVGNLSYQTRESELKEFCEAAGKVLECRIVFRGPRSQGYGFVTFETEDAMQKAIETLKDSELDHRKVNVEAVISKEESEARRAANPRRGGFRGRGRRGRGRGQRRPREPRTGEPSKTTVFVGNLPFNVVDQDLYNIFKAFDIVKAQVIRRPNGASLGFAFVTFSNHAEQERVLQTLTEIYCDERKLAVRAAYSDDAPAKDEE